MSATTAVNIVLQAIDRATAPIKKVLEQTERQVSKLQQRLDKFNQSILRSSDFRDAMLGVSEYGKGILGALRSPVQTAMAFEAQMSKVKAITRASDEEIQKLTANARHLGATTSFSATQAAAGMEYLGMAGFKTNQIIAAMPGMLNLAKAAGADLGRTADIASDIGSAFFGSDAANQIGRVADVLTHTFTSANVDLEMLSETMKYVGPVARSAGMGLEQTAAMAGLLGNVGIKASNSGTALRAMLSRLSAPPKPAADALKRLGVATKTATGDLRAMPAILADVAAAMDKLKLGGAERIAVFSDISGLEASAAMSELVTQAGDKGLAKYLETFGQVSGRSAEVAKVMGENLQGKVTELNSAWESVQITLGNVLIPTLTAVLSKGITPIVQAMDGWLQRHPVLVKNVMLVAGALGSLLLSFAAIGKAAWVANIIVSGFSLVLTTLVATPVGPILAAVAYAGYQIYQYWAPLSAFFGGFWDAFSSALAPLADLLTPLLGIFSGFGEQIQFTAAELQQFAMLGASIGSVLGSGLSTGLLFAKEQLQRFWQSLSGSALVQTLADGVRSAWQSLYAALHWVLQKVRNLLPFSPAKEGPLSDLDIAGQSIPLTLADNIRRKFSALYQAASEAMQWVANGLRKGWGYLGGGTVISDIQGLVQRVTQALEGMRQRIVSQPWEALGLAGIIAGLQTLLDFSIPVRDTVFALSEILLGSFGGDTSLLAAAITTVKTLFDIIQAQVVGLMGMDFGLNNLIGQLGFFALSVQNTLRFAFSWEGVKAGFSTFFSFTQRFVINYAGVLGSVGKMLISSWFMMSHALQSSVLAAISTVSSLFTTLLKSLHNPMQAKDLFADWANKARQHLQAISKLWQDLFMNPQALGGDKVKYFFDRAVQGANLLWKGLQRLGVWKSGGLLGAVFSIGSLLWKNREHLADWAQQWRNFLAEHIPGWQKIEQVAGIVATLLSTYFGSLIKPFQYIGQFIGNASAQAVEFYQNLQLPPEAQAHIESLKTGFEGLFKAVKTYAPVVLSIAFPLLSLIKLIRTPLPKLQKFQAILLVVSMMRNSVMDFLRTLGLLGGSTFAITNFWDELHQAGTVAYQAVNNVFDNVIATAGKLTHWWGGLPDDAKASFKKLAVVAGVALAAVALKVRSAIRSAACDPAYACANKFGRLGLILQRIPGLKALGGLMAQMGGACEVGSTCVNHQMSLWQRFKLMMLSAWTTLKMHIIAAGSAVWARLSPLIISALGRIRIAALAAGRATWTLLMRIPVVGHLARALLFASTLLYTKFASALLFAKALLLKVFTAVRVAAMANPIGAIITLVIALGAAAYWVYQNWGQVVAWWQNLWAQATQIFTGFVAWLNNLVPGLGDLFNVFFNLVGNIVNSVRQRIGEAVKAFSEGDWSGVGMPIINTIGDGVLAAGTALYDAVVAVFRIVRNLLPFSPAKEGPFSQLDQNGSAIINTIAQGVLNALSTLVNSVSTVFAAVFSWLQGVDWMGIGQSMMSLLSAGISSMASQLKDAIITPVREAAQEAANALHNMVPQGVKDNLDKLVPEAAKSAGADMFEFLLGKPDISPRPAVKEKAFFDSGRGAISAMGKGAASNVDGLKKPLAEVYKNADRLNPHSDAKEGPFSRLTASGKAILDTIGSGISQTSANFKTTFADALQNSVTGALSRVDPLLGQVGGSLIQSLREEGISGAINSLQQKARGILGGIKGNLVKTGSGLLGDVLKTGKLPSFNQLLGSTKTAIMQPIRAAFTAQVASKTTLPNTSQNSGLLGNMGRFLTGEKGGTSLPMPDLSGLLGGQQPTAAHVPSLGDVAGSLFSSPSPSATPQAGGGVTVNFTGDIVINGGGSTGEGQFDMMAIGQQLREQIRLAIEEEFRGRMFD